MQKKEQFITYFDRLWNLYQKMCSTKQRSVYLEEFRDLLSQVDQKITWGQILDVRSYDFEERIHQATSMISDKILDTMSRRHLLTILVRLDWCDQGFAHILLMGLSIPE